MGRTSEGCNTSALLSALSACSLSLTHDSPPSPLPLLCPPYTCCPPLPAPPLPAASAPCQCSWQGCQRSAPSRPHTTHSCTILPPPPWPPCPPHLCQLLLRLVDALAKAANELLRAAGPLLHPRHAALQVMHLSLASSQCSGQLSLACLQREKTVSRGLLRLSSRLLLMRHMGTCTSASQAARAADH